MMMVAMHIDDPVIMQGGWLVVLAYPHHCDCYAFLRAVAKAQGALDVVHDSEAMQS